MNDLRTAAQQALEALKSVQDHRPNDETNNAVTNLRAALAQQAEPVLQTCNCRWDGEVQVQQCTLHQSHIHAIHEWAERAKVAERKLAQQAEPHRDLREHMAEVQRLRAALAQPATIAEWWAAKQAASGEPFGYLWPTGMHPEFRFYQQKRDGVDGMPLYATAQPAPARVPPSVSPEAHADFVRALHGGKGDLDAWLECYDETEVRAHVLALIQPAASGEPVAWVRHDWSGTGQRSVSFDAPPDPKPVRDEVVNPIWTPLYAAPQPAPARVPLTDEQIDMITAEQWGRGLGAPYAAYRAYARAIEAAHGITAKEA